MISSAARRSLCAFNTCNRRVVQVTRYILAYSVKHVVLLTLVYSVKHVTILSRPWHHREREQNTDFILILSISMHTFDIHVYACKQWIYMRECVNTQDTHTNTLVSVTPRQSRHYRRQEHRACRVCVCVMYIHIYRYRYIMCVCVCVCVCVCIIHRCTGAKTQTWAASPARISRMRFSTAADTSALTASFILLRCSAMATSTRSCMMI